MSSSAASSSGQLPSASSSSRQLPSPHQVKGACASIGHRMGSYKYAIVGGAACQLLGSPRLTEDVDFVVLTGAISNVRKILAADKDQFTVEPRTLHTHYKTTPPVEIEILAPPGTFKEDFDQDTPTMTVEVNGFSVSILHPVLILNAKCRSVLGRANDQKKQTDAYDIKYLLRYLANARIFPTSRSLLNASKSFVQWFVNTYGEGDLWESIKYDSTTGSFEGAEEVMLKFNVESGARVPRA